MKEERNYGKNNKHAAKLPGNGGYVDAGPDLGAKQPTPYLYDAPSNVPHPEIHDSGIGGPSDREENGIDDCEE